MHRRVRAVALLAVAATLLAGCSSSSGPSAPAVPSPRTGAAAAFDEQTQQLVVFGGEDAHGRALGDTWGYDAHGWHRLAAGATAPPPRSGAAAAYDQEQRTVVLMGGHDGAAHLDDTWIWNGKQWSKGVALDAPAHDVTAVAMDYDRSTLQLDMVVCCTTGASAGPLSYIGDGRHWNLQDPNGAGVPAVRAGSTWLSAAFDLNTGRTMLLAPGAPGAPPVSSAFDGRRWEKLAPVNDLPPGAQARLVEAPDEGRLLGLVVSGPGGPGVWRWDGSQWVQISTTGLPRLIDATAIDVHDAQGLVLGSAAPGSPLSLIAWRKGSLQKPSLGGKAQAEPTYGAPTPTPTPVQVVKAARDYAPTPAELPVKGYGYTAEYGHGKPLTGADALGAADAWSVPMIGPGPKLVGVQVFVFANDFDAVDLATTQGAGRGVTGVHDQTTFQLRSGTQAYAWRAPIGDGTVEYWLVSWNVGRIAFQVIDRDYTGAQKIDDAEAIANVIDAKAEPSY